ncbi:MAG TPA: 6-bladed beta-propeller [Edaphocola sp.]|nr:6-bladed beta-propeller [Edaphocola sp.]
MKSTKLINNFYCILSIVFLLTNCKNLPDEINEFEIINIIDKVYNLDIDSVFTVESILPLKSNETSIINFIGKVYYVNSGYVLWDNFQNNIYKYDKKGNCLWKITTKGRGPGEFVHINDICLDYNEKYLFVLDGMQQRKVLKYSVLSGEFLTDKKVGFSAVAFHQFCSGDFAFYTGNNRTENNKTPNCNIILTDSTFQVVKTGVSFDNKWLGISIKHGNSSFFPIGKDSIIFSPQLPEIGDVYLLTTETIKPFYRFVTQNNHLKPKFREVSVDNAKEWLKENLVEYNINGFWQQNELLHFYVHSNENSREIIYNKLNGKCHSRLTNQASKKHAFFSPQSVFGKQAEGLFVNVLPAYAVVDKKYEVTASLGEVNENDNPILVFYRVNNTTQK